MGAFHKNPYSHLWCSTGRSCIKNDQKMKKRPNRLNVFVFPEEKEKIENQAKQAGLSISRYLREVGQGYEIKGVIDYVQVRELARINGDLGRLGGLLKLWLTDDVRTAKFGKETIIALLKRIEKTQEEMGSVMKSVMRPREGKKF